ncbi:acyltransferase [Microvirga rosea]|uniref:acyltransferase n=1 Tax=Microvirga rosea TaxID=2715425 RepID=UPI001D0B6FF9|nr:acyltransferase [Microvirga rosea]MCB8823005.1 acyltransferase [Microvirga rosea]
MLKELRGLQRTLQREKLSEFKRRVSWGDLITDRWENAREYGFGEGSSCYDNVLILGEVQVGDHTWIGPNVILDGSGGLTIGSHCSISAGVQIYSHDTVRRSITLGQEPVEYSPTHIGDGVYIGPNTVIKRGVRIGSQSIIGAMSYVSIDVPAGSKVWGCPARIVGHLEEHAPDEGASNKAR